MFDLFHDIFQARKNIMNLCTQLPVEAPEQLLQNNEITKNVMAFPEELDMSTLVCIKDDQFFRRSISCRIRKYDIYNLTILNIALDQI